MPRTVGQAFESEIYCPLLDNVQVCGWRNHRSCFLKCYIPLHTSFVCLYPGSLGGTWLFCSMAGWVPQGSFTVSRVQWGHVFGVIICLRRVLLGDGTGDGCVRAAAEICSAAIPFLNREYQKELYLVVKADGAAYLYLRKKKES